MGGNYFNAAWQILTVGMLAAFALSLAYWLRDNNVSRRGFRIVFRERAKKTSASGFEVKPITGQPPVLREKEKNDHG
jgi:hypothetical protein